MALPGRGYPFPHQSSSFSRVERWLLIIAVFLLIGALVGFLFDRQKRKTEQPIVGGTYTEGVVADSPTKVERIISRLTNIGLTYRETDGSIKPALADRWEVSGDGKVYTFFIHEGYNAEGLLSTIQNSKTSWTGIAIAAPTDHQLQFTLTEALPTFLPTTTEALFPFGPYEVVKRDAKEVVFRPNQQFVLGEPYIQKWVIKQYASQEELVKAAKDGEINGSADFTETQRGFTEHAVDLPRYYVLFLNMTRPAFKKIEDRQRIINQTDGSVVAYTLLTTQTGAASDLADSLVTALASKQVTLTVQKKNSVTLQKEDIPKREFDLLLFGMDYGIDRDYYPFWHSSQVAAPGLNIAGVKDKELDALLESARKETDPAKRVTLTKQVEDYLTQKAYQKIMGQEKFRFWIDKSIKGVDYGTIDEGTDRFQLVWRWYIKSKMVR